MLCSMVRAIAGVYAHRGRLANDLDTRPTLPQGSAQLVYIPKVKTDPNDQTVSISDLIATSMNADYDGDEVMFTLALDVKMAEMFYPFSPFFNLLLLSKPFEISHNASMTDSVVASASDWIEDEKRKHAMHH